MKKKKKTLRSTLYIPNAEKIAKSLQRVRDGTDWSCDSHDYEDGILIMDVKNGRNHYEIDFVFNPSGQMLREVDCAKICVSHNDGLGEFLSAPVGKLKGSRLGLCLMVRDMDRVGGMDTGNDIS